jgi:hypothetical protein
LLLRIIKTSARSKIITIAADIPKLQVNPHPSSLTTPPLHKLSITEKKKKDELAAIVSHKIPFSFPHEIVIPHQQLLQSMKLLKLP